MTWVISCIINNSSLSKDMARYVHTGSGKFDLRLASHFFIIVFSLSFVEYINIS